jgi:hypothetical protein
VAGGNIYETSTKDASCVPLATWKPQTQFLDFALTLAGTTNTDHTLYLLANADLASFDIVSGTFNVLGPSPAINSSGDMTSNGDGTLYYLQGHVSPHPFFELDPKNASVLTTNSVAAIAGGYQALAFFGGRFYVFENESVYEYDPLKKTTTLLGSSPLYASGAGQSTCVPKEPTDAGPPN